MTNSPQAAARPLVIMALPSENPDGLLNPWGPIHYSGVGKVNAAHTLTQLLSTLVAQDQPLPPYVLNLGSAGSRRFNTGTVALCPSWVQHDMDATPIGFKAGQTPFEDTPVTLTSPIPDTWASLGLPQATGYSGDQFVTTTHPHFPLDVVDMEGYALANVCRAFGVPLVSLKYITDGADGQAAIDWPAALRAGAEALRDTLKRLPVNDTLTPPCH